MSLNNITDANILPSDFSTENPFQSAIQTSGTDQHRNVVTYIKNLFREYIKVRNQGVTSDTYKVNKELLKKFKSDFKDLLLEISQKPDVFLDLENIINDVYKETQVSNKIVTEINSVILEIIKKAIKEKITGKIKDRLSVVDLTKLKTSIELSPLTDIETERIVNSIIVDTNPVIQNLQNELGVANQTYRDTLFDMFKTQLQDDADRRKYLEEYERRKPFNQLMEKFSLFGKMDRSVMKRIDSVCNRLFILINKSITEKALMIASKFVKFIAFIPLKILGAVGKFVKYIGKKFLSVIGWTVKTLGIFIKNIIKITTKIVIGLVSNLILKPIFFISEIIWKSLKTSFKIIGNLTQGIFRTVKFIFEKTKVHFLLLTPPGLYALGFLIGFVWEKLRKILFETTFPMDGVTSFYHSITQDIFNLVKGIINLTMDLFNRSIGFFKETLKSIDEYLWEHFPWMRRKADEIVDSTKEFLDVWETEGFKEAFKTTTLWKWMDTIINSPFISFAKTIFKTISGLYKWIGEHPSISAFLFGASYIGNLGILSKIRMLINFKGNILSGLIAGVTAYATMAATDSVISIFDGTADMKNASWKLADSDELLRTYIAQSSDNEHIFDKNNIKIFNKHQVASNYILENYQRIRKLSQELNILEDFINFKNKDESFENLIKRDIRNISPYIVNAILGGGQTLKYKKELNKAFNEGDINKQIVVLKNILTEQTDYITSLQQSLNSATSETVEDVLDSIVNDNFQIQDNRNKDVVSALRGIRWGMVNNITDKKLSQSEVSQIQNAFLNWVKISNIDLDEESSWSSNPRNISKYTNPSPRTVALQGIANGLLNRRQIEAFRLQKKTDDISKLFSQSSTTSTQREKFIEKIIQHGSLEDFKRINELLKKYDETQGMDSSIARNMETLKNEILERHRLKIEEQTKKAIYDYDNFTLSSLSDCEEYKISCDFQNNENDRIAKENRLMYPRDYYQEKIDQIRIPQKPNINNNK